MLDLKVGYSCNNNCIFCAVKNHEKKDRTFEEIDRILTSERKYNDEVIITGGEVTLRADFLKIIDRATNLDYKINIQSNGRLFSTNLIYYMNNYKINMFLISIHGYNSEIHDSLTRVKNSFDQTVSGIENLINCGHNVMTNTVIMNTNLKNIKDMCILLSSTNVKNVLFTYPDITSGTLENIDLIPSLSEVKKYIPTIVKTCDKLQMNVLFDNIPICVLGDYYNYDNKKQPIDLLLLDKKIKNFVPNTIINKCKNCNIVSSCCHPQLPYINKFGEGEFEASK